jgi:hypothetical protein
MGVDITTLRAINFARRTAAINFDRTVMLGRQEIFFTKEDFDFVKRRAKLGLDYDDSIGIGQFAESLFKKFGAIYVDSIDASDYEGASIIADFNEPLRSELRDKFTCFVDFGSIEHIFNIPQAISNISELLVEGGTVLIKTQANGYAGHGFYQISPELFYSAFSEENGFVDTAVFLVDLQDIARWYLVHDPRSLKKRNTIPEHRTYYVFCISTKRVTPTMLRVQQSDYEGDAWRTKGHSHMGEYRRSTFSKLRHLVNPFIFQNVRGRYYALLSHRKFRHETPSFDPDLISTRALDALRGLEPQDGPNVGKYRNAAVA